MTESRRIVLLSALASLAAVSLGACGFEPLHGTRVGPEVTANLAAIRIEPISDRSGQILRNYLLDRLTPRGGPARAEHVLRIRLDEPRQTLALRRDDVISRVSYSATATFDLFDAAGRRVTGGSSNYSTDYEITNSEFATLMASQSARERVLELVSDDIRSQLAAHFSRR
jgi:LPS-assembly lipoprotein